MATPDRGVDLVAVNRRLPARHLGIAAVLVALLAFTSWAPSSAFAHAAFLGSDPAPGARLASSPRQITLRFTEALNRRLSTGALYNAVSGKRVPVTVRATAPRRLVVRPASALARGAYRVEWHSVSSDDGHALEGSFSFGVAAAAVGGVRSSQASPLAGAGWLRVAVRAGLYLSLFLFAGATLLAAMLDRSREGPWLQPEAVTRLLGEAQRAALAQRYRSVVLDAGFLAAGLASASALLDAANAAGGLSASAIRDYLLTSPAGLARVAIVISVVLALPAAAIALRAGALSASLALGAMALAGHADSVSPRAAALLIDWLHLLAAAAWLGGIALLVATWGPALRSGERALRLAVARHVLPRFGRVALPAFAVVAVTGAFNALIEVGRVSALWESAYGRILLVKIALVGLIVAASYTHALRIRPRLLTANPHPDERLERRHWRLLRTEPVLAAGVAVAVALLVAFPLPRQSAQAALRSASIAACNPCPLPLPKAGQLAVADEGGSNIVAAWISRRHGQLRGEVRLIDIQGRPSSTPFEIDQAKAVTASCGPGCRRFAIRSLPATLRVTVHERGREYTATLPARWRRRQSGRARALLDRAQATMRRLRSVRETETVNSVPGLYAITDYRLKAPNRQASINSVLRAPSRAPVREGEMIAIGGAQWIREQGSGWQRSEFGGGLPFRTRSWFTWTTYAQAVRLLDLRRERGRPVAVIALMDPGTPAWWKLYIDLRTMRVIHSRLIATGHFMTQRYFAFNQPTRIRPPRGARR